MSLLEDTTLIVFFQSFRVQGPTWYYMSYISNFFTPRVTNYYLRGSGINALRPSCTNPFGHNSFSHIIAHTWNSFPSSITSAPSFQQWFRSLIKMQSTVHANVKKIPHSIVHFCSFRRIFILNYFFLFSRLFT